MRQHYDGVVLPNLYGQWRLTCQRARIRWLRFHDLKGEAGSQFLDVPGVTLADK
jgi:hypothetical protein